MRMLLQVRFPHKEFNEAVRNGTAGSKLNRILEALAEPWFLTFSAWRSAQ
jgi:hypothetical protein